jgi:hypothetical protein
VREWLVEWVKAHLYSSTPPRQCSRYGSAIADGATLRLRRRSGARVESEQRALESKAGPWCHLRRERQHGGVSSYERSSFDYSVEVSPGPSLGFRHEEEAFLASIDCIDEHT